jgi:hypothetical protein
MHLTCRIIPLAFPIAPTGLLTPSPPLPLLWVDTAIHSLREDWNARLTVVRGKSLNLRYDIQYHASLSNLLQNFADLSLTLLTTEHLTRIRVSKSRVD